MRFKISRSYLVSFCLLFFFSVASIASAQTDYFGLREAVRGTGVSESSLTGSKSIIATIIFNLLGMVGVIFLILMIWGGIMWMTSGGNEQRVTKAKSILTTATIGLIIVMTAYSVTYFITTSLTEANNAYSSCYPADFVGPLPEGAVRCP